MSTSLERQLSVVRAMQATLDLVPHDDWHEDVDRRMSAIYMSLGKAECALIRLVRSAAIDESDARVFEEARKVLTENPFRYGLQTENTERYGTETEKHTETR